MRQNVCQIINETKWQLNTIEIGKSLGCGKFGNIYLARYKYNKDEIVALKVITKDKLRKDKMEDQIRNEYLLQTQLDHKNIIKMYAHFCDNDKIYFILEYANGGDLYKELSKFKILPEKRVAILIKDIILALQYCHSRRIIHRDVKSDNILLFISEIEIAKLADFGLAVQLDPEQKYTHGFVGTPDYIPPEILLDKFYDYSVDIWSLGVVIYELLTGKLPFYGKTISETYKRIREVDLIFPESLSGISKDLLSKILVYIPDNRLTLQQILTHPFFQIL